MSMSFPRLSSTRLRPPPLRHLSTSFSSSALPERALVYTQTGDPTRVLRLLPYAALPPPPRGTLNLKFLLAPINPADLNVIEGVYPARPRPTTTLAAAGPGSPAHPAFVGGNEGLAQVTAVGPGDGAEGLKVGDWVVMGGSQLGTWCTSRNVGVRDVIKVPEAARLSRVQAATMTVNPPTAYNMLHDFVQLRPGDWLVQNGANSAVGQAVIQIARAKGFKTLNFVRSRDDSGALAHHLTALGADAVFTYDDLAEKSFRARVKEVTGGKPIALGLNCVGGPPTTSLSKLLGPNAHLVSYGAMSRAPLALPTSLFIFGGLTAHGFWQARKSEEGEGEGKGEGEGRKGEGREEVLRRVAGMMVAGELREPQHVIVKLPGGASRASGEAAEAAETGEGATEATEATRAIRGVFGDIASGKAGGKVLLDMD